MSRRVDSHTHHKNVVESNITTNKVLNNIHNSSHQDGVGGGNKLGVMTDSIASSNNTISSQSVLTASRLNNIQNAITQDGLGGGNKLGVMTDAINTNVIASNAKLDTIATNTANIKIDTGDIDLNTDGLEALQTATKNTLFTNPDGTGNTIGENASAINANINTANGKLDTIITNTAAASSAGSATSALQTTLINGQTQNGDGTGNKIGVMIDAINSNTITGNGKLDTLETSNTLIVSSINSRMATVATANDNIASAQTADGSGGGLKPGVMLNNIKTAVELIDDAIVTDDAAVTLGSQKGVAIMGFAGTQSVNANDACMLACSTAGRLEVDVKNEVEVTNPGSFSVQEDGDALTALQLIDDAIVIDDAAVTLGSQKGVAIMGFAGTQSVNANDAAMLACSTAGRLEVDVKNTVSTAVTNTTLTNLNNCIGTNELQVDIVASLPTGSNAIGKLSANSGVDIGDVDVTSLPLTFNSGNKDATCQRVVVATDDVNLSAIKSSLDNLDNAVDGNYLNVNANIAGTDVDANSGNKSAATQRVVIADDDVNLSAIKTSIEAIDNAVDGNYLNVNANIAGTDVDANSGNKSAATQRVVIADDDVNLSAIKTAVELLDDCIGTDNSTGPAKCISIGGTNLLGGAIQEIACDGDGHLQVDVLSSALPSGAAQELSNSAIATKATLATSAEIKELLSGATVNAGVLSAELDTEHYERIRLFGETSASTGSDIKIFGSNTSGGTYYYLNNGDLQAQSLLVSGLGSVHYIGGSFENIPRYIKIFNNNGSANYTFTKLYMVGSGGRVAV